MRAIMELTEAVRASLKQGRQMMKTLADLQADVAAETTQEKSLETLVSGMAAQIAALKTTQTDPATAAAIDSLATQIEQNTSDLSNAVTANTPDASA
jgi:DNA-binding transcriptional LysR family regulator